MPYFAQLMTEHYPLPVVNPDRDVYRRKNSLTLAEFRDTLI